MALQIRDLCPNGKLAMRMSKQSHQVCATDQPYGAAMRSGWHMPHCSRSQGAADRLTTADTPHHQFVPTAAAVVGKRTLLRKIASLGPTAQR